MIVILAEKPSQAKAYADAFSGVKRQEGYFEISPCPFFQQGAKLTWGIGHLVELKEPHEYKGEWKKWNLSTLPVVPETFQFRVSSGKLKQFNIVKQLLKESDGIIVATDCDREGENIARSIITLAGASRKPTKRLWINSLEVDEVRRGFQQLREGKDYIPFYYEAQARQISDWVVGINSSRLYTLLLQQKGIKDVFSVGRVQTPTLKLIYDRQQAIEDFKPEPFFELEALFHTEVGDYKGKVKEKFKSEMDVQALMEKQQILLNHPMPGKVKSVEVSLKRQKAPRLHSLSSLQSLANRKYKYSPKKVLDLVQSLYDSPLKLVTYPRTDTPYITENEFAYLKEGIGGYQQVIGHPFQPARLQPNKYYVDGSKVQEHYAIVPTKNIPKPDTLEKLSRDQKNIYFEIVKSILAMFHRDYQYEETTLITAINQVEFITKGKVEIDPGWKELFRNDPKVEEKKEEDASILPPVKEGMDATGIVSAKKSMTQPPKPYTEGQLIHMMKTCGQAEELSAEEKSILKEVEGLGTEATRSGIIETLKKQKYIEVRKNQVSVTPKGEILCQAVTGTLLSKPEMTAKWEMYLKQIGQGTKSKEAFIENTILFVQKLIEDAAKEVMEMAVDKEVAAQIKGNGKEKGGYSKTSFEKITLCPSCKKGSIMAHKTFYGCSEYKNGCKQTFPKVILGKNLTKTQVKHLCEKGKTNKMKGFKGKKEFDACLVLKDGKIEFEFE